MTTLPKPIKEATLSTYQQIINKGIEQGIEQGIRVQKIQTVKNMLENKVSDEAIMKILAIEQGFIDEVRDGLIS